MSIKICDSCLPNGARPCLSCWENPPRKKSLVRTSDDRAVLGGDDGRDTIIVRPARCIAENLRSEYLFHMLYYNIYLYPCLYIDLIFVILEMPSNIK